MKGHQDQAPLSHKRGRPQNRHSGASIARTRNPWDRRHHGPRIALRLSGVTVTWNGFGVAIAAGIFTDFKFLPDGIEGWLERGIHRAYEQS